MKKLFLLLSALVIASMLITACGAPTTPAPAATAAPAATDVPAPTAVPATAVPAATVAPTAAAPAAVALPDLGGKKIVVAVENAYPPFNSIDATTNKPVGWDYETVTEICKRLNCVVEFKQAAWDGIFSAMAAGEYDMLADGVTFTEERAKTVDFSTPYVSVSQVVLVRVDDTRTPEQLKADAKAKLSTQIGTTNEIAAKKYFTTNEVKSFEDFGAAVLAVISKDVDGCVIDFISAQGYMKDNAGKLKIAGEISTGEQLAFAFPPKSTLKDAVNAALADMTADGTLAALNKKYGLTQ
jgi:polar amino acid transport system substrate-binding protein